MRYFTGLNSDTGQTEVINLEEEINESLEQVEGQIEGKLDAPEVEGTEGQVLMTDGEGGRSWGTINGAEIKNDTDLVIAEDTTPKITLDDFEIGTTIYIKENDTPIAYMIVEEREYTKTLIRKTSIGKKRFDGNTSATYIGSEIDTWLNSSDGYLGLFSSSTLTKFSEQDIYVHGDLTHSKRKAFLPSAKEVNSVYGYSNYDDEVYGTPWENVYTLITSNFSVTGQIMTRTIRKEDSAAYVTPYRPFSTYSGKMSNYLQGEGSQYKTTATDCYPCLFVLKNSEIDTNTLPGQKLLKESSITYTGTIDKLQDGNNYYKFSDQDARASITAIKDGTSIDSFGDVETALGNKANDSQTVDDTTKTVNGWIEYLVDEIDGVENLIGSGVISNGD